ncbi:MAG: carboxypeptidase, partial [Planctomycetes bacterium]|nr:carboxypeptidase [Planctomycetota bacterium]
LRIENEGWLPTNVSQKAVERKVVRPVEVTLELAKGQSLEIGKKRTETGHLAGAATTLCDECNSSTWFGGSSREAEAYLEWCVRGTGPLAVTVKSDRAGTVRGRCGEPREKVRGG